MGHNATLARTRPAGAVPTSGAPEAMYPAGTYPFDAHVLVVGTVPTLNAGAFPARLAQTIAASLPAASARIADLAVSSATAPASDRDQIPFAGRAQDRPPATWLLVEGTFTSPNVWQTAGLRAAIAQAVASVIRFGSMSTISGTVGGPNGLPYAMPVDASPLLATMNQGSACLGFADYTRVYARACVRVGDAMAPSSAPPVVVPDGNRRAFSPPATPPTPSPTAPSGSGGAWWKWLLGLTAAGGLGYAGIKTFGAPRRR